MNIFVFPATERGGHAHPVAKRAIKEFGAKKGVGSGPAGNSYAITTRGYNGWALKLSQIKQHVDAFLAYAVEHPDDDFDVQPFHFPMRGIDKGDIASLLHGVPPNVHLPKEYERIICNQTESAFWNSLK